MALKINKAGISRARSLIKSRKIDHGEFDESKVDRSAANANAFAAVDDSEQPDTQAHWKFPIVVGGKVSSRAVGNGITRAESNGYTAVAAKLRVLSDLINQHTAMSALDLDPESLVFLANSDVELEDEEYEDEEMSVQDAEQECMTVDDSATELANSDVELDVTDIMDESMRVADEDPDDFDDDEDGDEDEDEDEDITDERNNPLYQQGNDGTMPPIPEGREQMSANANPGFVSLRSANISGLTSPNRPVVDRTANAIRNVSVMQAGPAKGHGFAIDGKMLRQVADQFQGGKAMRFTHPQKLGSDGNMMPTDPLGTHVGRVKNVRLSDDGSELRGDMEFGPHAKHVPLYGDVQSYLMDLAESDPESFGLSTVFKPGEYERDPRTGVPLGRSEDVVACDLTGDPASNRRGLC